MEENLYNITFVDEEPFCRIDNVLLDEELWLKRTGIPGEFDSYSDDERGVIVFNDKIYTKTFEIGDIIPCICFFEEGTGSEYDKSSNAGRGEMSHYLHEKFTGRDGSFILRKEHYDVFTNYKIVPFDEFYKDFPLFNKEEYFKIMDSLDKYYEKSQL